MALKFTKKKNNYANLLNCACKNTEECITFPRDIDGNIFRLALWREVLKTAATTSTKASEAVSASQIFELVILNLGSETYKCQIIAMLQIPES